MVQADEGKKKIYVPDRAWGKRAAVSNPQKKKKAKIYQVSPGIASTPQDIKKGDCGEKKKGQRGGSRGVNSKQRKTSKNVKRLMRRVIKHRFSVQGNA